MVPTRNIRTDMSEAIGQGVATTTRTDPAERLAQVALAVYLTPIVALVCAIGGLFIAFEKISRSGHPLKPREASGGDVRLDTARNSGHRMMAARLDRERRRARVVR